MFANVGVAQTRAQQQRRRVNGAARGDDHFGVDANRVRALLLLVVHGGLRTEDDYQVDWEQKS